MKWLAHLIRSLAFMLFAAFGANAALAMPLVASDITYFQGEPTHIGQTNDVGFAARAPPMAAVNLAATGGVTVMQGGAFALLEQEMVAALFGFSVNLNAPNRTPTYQIGDSDSGPGA